MATPLTSIQLPVAPTQFLDATGAALGGGKVYYYIPATTTLKTTWQDPLQSTPNTNPVLLDSSGRATIYGYGEYRQLVLDALGNTISDSVVYGQGPIPVWGGISTGGANAQVLAASNFDLSDGEVISFQAGFTNTASMTLTPNSTIGALSLYQNTRSGPSALVGGEVHLNNIYQASYSASLGVLILINGSPAPVYDYAAATGTADAQVASFNPLVGQTVGRPLEIKAPASTNTLTAPTLNVDATMAVAILNVDGSALTPGEIHSAGIYQYVWNGTNWILQNPSPVNLRKIGAPIFVTATGSAVPPAGAAYYELWAKGGGAGGGAASSAANSSGGAGAGGEGAIIFLSSFVVATLSVVIGAKGTGSTSNASAGTTGGTTTVAGVSAAGGVGGSPINASSRIIAAGGGVGGAPTGGTQSWAGQPGSAGTAAGTSGNASQSASGGNGGGSLFGTGGIGGHVDTSAGSGAANGANGAGYGTGGGGGCSVNTATVGNGGDGTAGVVVIQWYGLY